jgi:integrase
MILVAYRHGLRASELCELTWNMIELDSGRIHVRQTPHARYSALPAPFDDGEHASVAAGT